MISSHLNNSALKWLGLEFPADDHFPEMDKFPDFSARANTTLSYFLHYCQHLRCAQSDARIRLLLPNAESNEQIRIYLPHIHRPRYRLSAA